MPTENSPVATSDGTTTAEAVTPHPTPAPPHPHGNGRMITLIVIGVIVLILLLVFGIPAILHALNTVSTDDAYINGHVTFTAPRVAGQVTAVLVDDNNRVHKGDLLVQLDKEPYQAIVNIKAAAVASAEADVTAAQASTRGLEAQARSLRWKLQHAMEQVEDSIAQLKTAVAALDSAKAVATRAKADLDRAMPLAKSGAVASEEIDRRTQVLAVADANVKEAMQAVYQIRVSLGLPAQPANGGDLAEVPADLDETFSSVRQAQAELMQAASQVGVIYSLDAKPKQMLADFLKRDPEGQGNIDRIYADLLKNAPAVRQAEQKLMQARRDLEEALLDLRYTDIFAEIDGVITRRNVNPGNNVVAGQSLMAIRSLTDIWVDANFKETELADLRIGQPVELHLDMYGGRHQFKGRVSGFTMGTGSTLALLPAQNATGNFVKVVQRLPVRIDIEDYDPDVHPLFIGLSVEPSVLIHEKPTGPDAGKLLQPYIPATTQPAATAPSEGGAP